MLIIQKYIICLVFNMIHVKSLSVKLVIILISSHAEIRVHKIVAKFPKSHLRHTTKENEDNEKHWTEQTFPILLVRVVSKNLVIVGIDASWFVNLMIPTDRSKQNTTNKNKDTIKNKNNMTQTVFPSQRRLTLAHKMHWTKVYVISIWCRHPY